MVKELKNKLVTNKIAGLALDIDETLSDTNSHWFEHMFHFHAPSEMTKDELIKRYKSIESVPDWQTGEALKYVEKILHSNEFNETVPLIEGAVETVQEINKIAPIVAYITARPATVRDGTLKWLKKHGFPEATLITRPEKIEMTDFNLNKNRWKAKVLVDLYPEITGIVDDNSILAHELEALEYKGLLYLYGKESEEFNHHQNVVVCPTWKKALKSIRNA